MRHNRLYVILVLGVLLISLGVLLNVRSRSSPDIPFLQLSVPVETAPLCPWREPEKDLQVLFPGANRYQSETRVLSSRRLELAQRLGRTPSGEENALHLYPVYSEQSLVGAVMVRRVKGDFGAIEIVVGVNTNGAVQGVRLQRLREPEEITRALTDPAWLAAFEGKTANSDWNVRQDTPGLPEAARPSAQAIVEGVRSLMIMFATAEDAKTQVIHKH